MNKIKSINQSINQPKYFKVHKVVTTTVKSASDWLLSHQETVKNDFTILCKDVF